VAQGVEGWLTRPHKLDCPSAPHRGAGRWTESRAQVRGDENGPSAHRIGPRRADLWGFKGSALSGLLSSGRGLAQSDRGLVHHEVVKRMRQIGGRGLGA